MTCPVCEKWQIDDVAVAGDLQRAVALLCKHMRACAADRAEPARFAGPPISAWSPAPWELA